MAVPAAAAADGVDNMVTAAALVDTNDEEAFTHVVVVVPTHPVTVM